MRAGSYGHGVPREPRQKHPVVQPEPDGSQSVELQPGPAGHRPAAGSSAAVPGNFTALGLYLNREFGIGEAHSGDVMLHDK